MTGATLTIGAVVLAAWPDDKEGVVVPRVVLKQFDETSAATPADDTETVEDAVELSDAKIEADRRLVCWTFFLAALVVMTFVFLTLVI